tara:strand:+ start:188 stop:1390 length:1203 start_codon:yes stop_codon:yes gene_type:complete
MSGGMKGGGGVSEEMLTTKGDTHGYTTENARVPIGTNDQVLTADSTTALGLAWKTSGGGIEYSELTTATTFTPTVQTGLVKVTVDGTDMTSGNIDVNVDGSSIKNVTAGTFENRVVNPATSLSIVSNTATAPAFSAASYDSVSFSIASQETNPRGMDFKPDGTIMYIMGNNTAWQYTLSTAWDLSTASYASKSFFAGAQDNSTYDIKFKPDGTSMYIVGSTSDSVHQYTLSTAWDISTASYASKSLSVTSQDNSPLGLTFKPDGTIMYIAGNQNDSIYQYTLSTAWDLSTASYASKLFSVSSQLNQALAVVFNSDGTKMYVSRNTSDATSYQYSLSTAWDITTSSYDSASFSFLTQDIYPSKISFSSDATKMFMLGGFNKTVYQYSTAGTFAGTARISIG